jgi:predicted amino acid racemase
MPFLDRTVRRNPGLIRAAVSLHQGGEIPPNTLLLDFDRFVENARLLKDEAERQGLRLYFMTKQHGRNPLVFGAITTDGRASTVAVDMQCAQALHGNQIGLGHIGNLSQVPSGDLDLVIGRMRPEVMSLFSLSKAEEASTAAIKAAVVQDVLLRVRDSGDIVFPGMAGGFLLAELPSVVARIRALAGIRIVGVTTFPAVSYNDTHVPTLTANFDTLLRGADLVQRAGVAVTQINAPGNTATNVLNLLASAGATHVEPGSALSGHTTFHLLDDGLVELPAAVYVTEVSHFVDGQAWTFGGGFFLDDPPVPQLADFASRRAALIGREPDDAIDHRVPFLGIGAPTGGRFGGIDYHGVLDVGESGARVGDTVVFGFRTQAFVTRAYVGVVEGTSSGSPRLLGLFDVQGHRLDPITHW